MAIEDVGNLKTVTFTSVAAARIFWETRTLSEIYLKVCLRRDATATRC